MQDPAEQVRAGGAEVEEVIKVEKSASEEKFLKPVGGL